MQRQCPNCGRCFKAHAGIVTCRRCGNTWGPASGKTAVYLGLGSVWLGAVGGMGEIVETIVDGICKLLSSNNDRFDD